MARVTLPVLEFRYERRLDDKSAVAGLAGYGTRRGDIAFGSIETYSFGGRYAYTLAGDFRTGVFGGGTLRVEQQTATAPTKIASTTSSFNDSVDVTMLASRLALAAGAMIGGRVGTERAFVELEFSAGYQQSMQTVTLDGTETDASSGDAWLVVGLWLGLYI